MVFHRRVLGFFREQERRAAPRRAELSLPLRILTSPKTTAVLGGVLAGLIAFPTAVAAGVRAAPAAIGRAAFGTPRRAIGTLIGVPTAAAVLAGSPIARRFAKTALDPRESFRRGQRLAEFIEDPTLIPTGPRGIPEGLKKAGIAGGILAAGAGLVVGGREIARRVRARQRDQPLAELPAGALPASIGTVVGTIPVTPTEPIAEERKVVKEAVPIKITNKQRVNVIVQNAFS